MEGSVGRREDVQCGRVSLMDAVVNLLSRTLNVSLVGPEVRIQIPLTLKPGPVQLGADKSLPMVTPGRITQHTKLE